MKQSVRMLSLALVLLLTALILGGSAGAESAETDISGTLRASSLADGAAVHMIGDTTLILDAPKTVTSIRGEYRLSLRGAQTLTVKNPAGTAIDVDSLLVRGSIAAEGEYGVRADGDVEIAEGTVRITAGADGISSEHGTVTLAGSVEVNAGRDGVRARNVSQTGTLAVTAGGDGVRAQEAIRTGGTVTARGGGSGLYAQKDVTAEGGSIDARGEKNDGIHANTGAVTLQADVTAEGGVHGVFAHGDVRINGKTDARGLQGSGVCTDGSAALTGELRLRGGEYGVYARTDAALDGSGSAEGGSNDGVRALTGQVTLRGELTCTGLYGVFGGGGVAMTGGTLEARSTRGSAIVSEYGSVTLDGSVKAAGAEYGVYAYTDLTLNGTVEAESSLHDGIRAHTGTVTITADVTAVGPLHCIFGGGGVAIRSGSVVTGAGSGAGVYSEYGPVSVSGELEAAGSEYGVYAYTDVNVENARVSAVSDQHDGIRAQTGTVNIAGAVEATGELYGVYAYGGLHLSRGSLTAVGNKYNGIYAIAGPVSVSGDVNASGGYYGIYADGDVTVTVGTVHATGRKDGGIVSGYGAIQISGHVTATGGEYGVFCDRVFELSGGSLTASGGNYDGVHVRSGAAELDGEMHISAGYFGIIANEIRVLGGNLDVSGGSSGFFSRTGSITIDPSLRLAQPTGAAVDGVTIQGPDRRDATRVVIADPDAPVNPFTDVREDSYYYDPVQWAVYSDPQITTGTTPTTFSPDATCTRAQAVTFLWRARGCPEPTISECRFVDVAESAYYYKAVLWAVEQGITIGTSDTTFSPELGCTRAHVVTFLHREQHGPAPASDFNPFGDVAEDVYYYLPVLWAVERGVTVGTTPTTFSPHAVCTRAQIVTFLYRDTVYAAG